MRKNESLERSQFVARKQEIKALRHWLTKPGHSQLTAIYGRRRIGKTRLIEEAFKDTRILHFEGLEGQPGSDQRIHFIETLYSYSNEYSHRVATTKNWKQLLILLSEYIGREKTVIFFDEFQWMAAEKSRLVSILKFVWDNFFKKNNNVHLIICGSISSFIIKKVVQSKALYGRFDLEIDLPPLTLPEMRNGFFGNRSLRENVEYYMTLGGVPKYLELCDPNLSALQNIHQLFFSPYASLQKEFEALFAKEKKVQAQTDSFSTS